MKMINTWNNNFVQLFHPVIFVSILFFVFGVSCRSNTVYSAPGYVQDYAENNWGLDFLRYPFEHSRVLNESLRQRWRLKSAPYLEYVLFVQLYRDFLLKNPGKERLYFVGRREILTEEVFQTQRIFYDVLLLLEAREESVFGRLGPLVLWQSISLRDISEELKADSDGADSVPHSFENFFLAVQDFDVDGRDDLFFGFEPNRKNRPLQYYLYSFAHGKAEQNEVKNLIRPLIQPWVLFSREERENGTAKRYSPFMREISADIYPAFVAEIELDLNYKINIDLSPMSDVLIREQVYDKNGAVRQKLGIPHLDFNPILFPVRHKSGYYMVRSVQQVRNRYGQIGIFVCNWSFRDQRWVPDEASMEFLAKPRV